MIKTGFIVVEIIDEYSLLIDYGAEKGAVDGEKVRVIEVGPEVIHPKTKQKLGTLDSIKSELEIVDIYQHFSVCRKVVSETYNVLINPFSQFEKERSWIEKLNVDANEISHKSPPKDTTIAVGDLVQIL